MNGFWLFLDKMDSKRGSQYEDAVREFILVPDGWAGMNLTAFFAKYSTVEMFSGEVYE